MAKIERFEAARARWILSHAGPVAMQRRRGEIMANRVREVRRREMGADVDPQAEKVTDRWVWRVAKNHGAGPACAVVIAVTVLALLFGVSVLVASVVYGAAWRAVPRRIATIPLAWIAVAGIAATASGIGLVFLSDLGFWWSFVALQPGAGLLGAGVHTVLTGWLAVPGTASFRWPTPKIAPRSTGKGTVEADDLALDPMAAFSPITDDSEGIEIDDLAQLLDDEDNQS